MKKYIVAALALAPSLAFAQLQNVNNLLLGLKTLVNTALPIVVGLALLAFFWGLAKFIFSADDEEKRKEAKSLMIYSIIALFVMVSVWGLVRFIGNALGVNPDTAPNITTPTVNGNR
ncbi:pilin [Candidatus Parcubacteria bacterium]|nr:pilin [Candidatus Parcubacteria bacterium]